MYHRMFELRIIVVDQYASFTATGMTTKHHVSHTHKDQADVEGPDPKDAHGTRRTSKDPGLAYATQCKR